MKTYKKNEITAFSPTDSTKSSFSPTLTDCKSSIDLWQSFEEAHNHCETKNSQGAPKSTNRQFLRHTVNINQSELSSITSKISAYQNNRNNQKNICSSAPSSATDLEEYSTTSTKVISQYEKRNSNPEKKEGVSSKQNIIPKFLEKKLQLLDKVNNGISKTEKAGMINLEMKVLEKKTFTPKPTKIVENRNLRNFSEIPFCPSEYLQKKFNSSPTRKQSLSHGCFKDPKITDFKKLKFLGEGRFGEVHLVVHLETNFICALKQIKKECIRKNKMEDQLMMEIKMQSYLNHPNILKLYGFFNDENNIYLILEFMEEGTLYSQLKKLKKIPEDQAARKLKDVLDGVNYLHQHKIAHRDIKPENIVLSNDVPKLCDLGWAAVCEDRRKTLCGTIDYAPPEILEGKEYGIAIDLWCLGVLCYELMVGKCPFYHMSQKETMKKIINADQENLKIPEHLTEESRDFISRLLVKNPEERMSAFEALNHSLIILHHDKELEELKSSQSKKF